jgi:hypothetical protein
MIPAGYMAKRINDRPEGLGASCIENVYSVSNCVSSNFADYINYWRHNGYWFFDSPDVIKKAAEEHSIDLTMTILFYYEVYEFEFHEKDSEWYQFKPEATFLTEVAVPRSKQLAGYDIVTFSAGTSPECSPLSCNLLAKNLTTNEHCLLDSFEISKQYLEEGRFTNTEPGPYRIFAVYAVEWP